MATPTLSDAELMDRFDALELLWGKPDDARMIAQVAKETGESEERVEAVWQRWIVRGWAI